MGVVTIDVDDGVMQIGIDRPDAYNLWNLEVIREVSLAYRRRRRRRPRAGVEAHRVARRQDGHPAHGHSRRQGVDRDVPRSRRQPDRTG